MKRISIVVFVMLATLLCTYQSIKALSFSPPGTTATTSGGGGFTLNPSSGSTTTTSSSGGITFTPPPNSGTTTTSGSGGLSLTPGSGSTTTTSGSGGITFTPPPKSGTTTTSGTGGWTLGISETGVQIYQTAAYQTVSESLFSFQMNLSDFMDQNIQTQTSATGGWSLVPQSDVASSTPSVSTPQTSDINYGEQLSKFLVYITGTSDSYLFFAQQIFTAYGTLYEMYQGQTSGAADPSAQEYFLKLPFQQDSFALELVQNAMGSLIQFVTARMKGITVSNYYSDVNTQFFVGSSTSAGSTATSPSTLAQLSQTVAMFNTLCETEYKKAIAGLSDATEIAALKSNYETIINSYQKEVGRLVIAFNLKLLSYLNKQYPMALTLNPNITEINIYFDILQELYTFSENTLPLLEPTSSSGSTTKTLLFDQYETTDAVINAIRAMLAQLYVYAGTVGQHSINKDIEKQTIDASSLQNRMLLIHAFFNQAAVYYHLAGDTSSHNTYGTLAASMASAAQAWVNAQEQDVSAAYSSAATQYGLAYQDLQQAGAGGALAFYMLRLKNQANLNYAQQLIKSYCNYSTYQKNIATYIENAGNPSLATDQADTFKTIFYTPDSAFNGIGMLASAAAQSYKIGLNSLQTSTVTANQTEKMQLQNALTSVENIGLGTQAMLITTTDSEGNGFVAADADLLIDYYEPESVFEGIQRYDYIIRTFSLADQAIKTMPTNPYAPFVTLFSQSKTIKTFANFVRLHLACTAVTSAVGTIGVITNPAYAQYKNGCIVSSLLSFQCAQKMYAALGNYDAMVAYCKTESAHLKPYVSTILSDAQGRITGKSVTQQQYQMAIAECLGVALLGDATGASQYVSTLKSYSAEAQKNTFQEDFPQLTEAYAYYQLYLWSMYPGSKESADSATYKTSMQSALQDLIQAINTQVTTANSSSNSMEDRIAAQLKLQSLQSSLEDKSEAQKGDQALLGLSSNDFCELVQSVGTGSSSIEQLAVTFPLTSVKTTLQNPLYELAQLYNEEAGTTLANLKVDFTNQNYTTQTEETFTGIMENYTNALSAYAQLGLQSDVLAVEHSMTQAMAFRYYSLVIPSDPIASIKLQEVATITKAQPGVQSGATQTSGTGGWTFGSASTQTQTSGSGGWTLTPVGGGGSAPATSSQSTSINLPQTLPLNFPPYLLRYWLVNLTELSNNADTLATQAQKNIKTGSGVSIPPVIAQKKQVYNSLLAQATSLVGKSGSQTTTDIVTNVAVPLYKEKLTAGGFQGVFRTLDQEVDVYKSQLTYMIGTGMTIASNSIKTTLEITTQKNATTGKEDVVLIGHYVPLPAVPRFKNDSESAIFYYTYYAKFFDPGGQPILLGNATFFPIGGSSSTVANERLQAEKDMDRAYLASTLRFSEEITNLTQSVASMSASQKLAATFSQPYSYTVNGQDFTTTYSLAYAKLGVAYQWISATYSGVEKLQQDQGVVYVDVEAKKRALFQEYAGKCKLFLFGTPLDPYYTHVIKDVGDNYIFATQYASSTSTYSSGLTESEFKNQMYQNTAQLNVTAGDWCIANAQAIPQVAGYPSTTPSSMPSSLFDLSSSVASQFNLSCDSSQPTYLMPKGQTLAWKYYEQAQGYYSEALKLYTQGYEAANSGSQSGMYSNQTIRNVAGKNIMSSLWAALQRVAVFTQNACVVTETPNAKEKSILEYASTLSKTFSSIVKEGSSAGGVSALQGAQHLVSGGSQSSNSNAQGQYILMKKILLDALIYLSGATGSITAVSSSLSTSSDSSTAIETITGNATLCSVRYNMPNATGITQGSSKTSTPTMTPILAFAKTPSQVNLQTLLNPNWQTIVLCSDTFPSLVQYVTTILIGDESNNFASLNSSSQLAALSGFVGQLNGMWRDLYQRVYLQSLLSTPGDGITKAETSLNSAIKAEEQRLLVNPTGYIG